MSTENTVFISYRRSVSWSIARLIFKDLHEHGYDVFMDVENIDSGPFDKIILNQIAARAHFLVILTLGTVERCTEPGDWLRREIEHAMNLRRNIVPILVNNFTFIGTEVYLTGTLSELSRYNGLTLPQDYFEAAMERLRSRFLKQPVHGEIKPAPSSENDEVQRKIEEITTQIIPAPDDLTAEQYFKRGYEHEEQGDQEGAILNYTHAIRLNLRYANAYNNRGNIFYRQQKYAHAIVDYNQALIFNPEFADAYSNRGAAHEQQNDHEKALADYEMALQIEPQNEAAYHNRARLFRKMNK